MNRQRCNNQDAEAKLALSLQPKFKPFSYRMMKKEITIVIYNLHKGRSVKLM